MHWDAFDFRANRAIITFSLNNNNRNIKVECLLRVLHITCGLSMYNCERLNVYEPQCLSFVIKNLTFGCGIAMLTEVRSCMLVCTHFGFGYVSMCANKRFYASMITAIREMTTDFTVVATVSVCNFHYDCSFIIIHSFTPPFSKAIITLGGWMAAWCCMHRHMNGKEDVMQRTLNTQNHCVSLFKRYLWDWVTVPSQ